MTTAWRDGVSKRGGFTLVEILIALAIVGIVVMIAATSFQGMMRKYRVEGETKQMFAELTDARARAMQRNRAFFVRIDTNGYRTYEDTFPAPDGNGVLDNDALLADTTVTNTIVTDNIAVAPLTFRFDRNGIASVAGFIRFSSTVQPDYDCITIRETRIKLGQYDATGGTCVEK